MRLSVLWKIAAILALCAIASIAIFDPGAFAGVRGRAGQSLLWLALSLLAASFGAKLTLAVPAFGAHAHISAPLMLAIAAPYLLRQLASQTRWRSLTAYLRPTFARTPRSASRNPGVYPIEAPAALPARVATALAAAARARRAPGTQR